MGFTLEKHIARQPIMDEPYKRHLKTEPLFWEAQRCRLNGDQNGLEAVKAKAELMAAMDKLETKENG